MNISYEIVGANGQTRQLVLSIAPPQLADAADMWECQIDWSGDWPMRKAYGATGLQALYEAVRLADRILASASEGLDIRQDGKPASFAADSGLESRSTT